MAEYSKLAAGTFTTAASPVTQVVNLPFQPQRIKLLNVTSYSTPAQFATQSAVWDINMGQGTALINYISAGTAPWNVASDYVGTFGISTFSAGLALQYGPQIQIASIAKGSPTVVTTAAAHGLSVGQVVILEGLYQSPTTGMPQMSNIPFVITAVGSPTTFTVLWNSNQSNYTALTGSPAGAFVRQLLYPWIYEPGVNVISTITLSGTNVVVTTVNNHNYVVGQEIAFRIPSVYGSTQLNSLPNNLRPGTPMYYHVTSLQSNTQFTCTALSAGVSAFNNNQPVSSVPGLQLPQVLAVGDVNSGGTPYSGGVFYPPPQFPTFSGGVPTINGPAISGAFVNNTSQGFVIGLGTGTVQTSALLLTASSVYLWEAFYYDFGS